MKKQINILFLGLALFSAVGCGTGTDLVIDTSTRGMLGGVLLTASEELRSGIVYLAAPLASDPQQSKACTGAVLRSSTMRNETHILTAAHCVAGTTTPVMVASDSDFTTFFGSSNDVTPNPAYDPDFPSRSAHDLAIIRLPNSIQINSPSGAPIKNWYRPIYGHNPTAHNSSDTSVRIFGAGCQSETIVDGGCGIDGTVRYIVDSEYSYIGGDEENVMIEDDNSSEDPQGGDSGGPWITAYGTAHSSADLVNHGVILGVHTGTHYWDEFGASTFGSSNLSFILSNTGDATVVVSVNDWERECFHDWCHYRPAEKAAHLINATLL
jgi:hypothetical protein